MLIKIDLLSVECLDKIHACLDMLTEYNYIDANKSLRERYEEAIGIYNIERTNQDMWKLVWEHKIQSLFQMEQQSGIQGIAVLKPTSVDDLAVLNSTIRLMTQEGSDERPTDKLARFKRDSKAWDAELKQWGLGSKEKAILKPVLDNSYGLCIAQEQFMQLVQLPELGGFNLGWADKLRKSIAKKNPKEFDKLTEDFYKTTQEQNIAKNFAKYVWEVLISMSKGYGFNQSHTLAYSLIALQEMNLCFKYPIIFWNTACLIVNSGSLEDNSEEEIVDIYENESDVGDGVTYTDLPDRKGKVKKTASTDYSKLAKAIGDTQKLGIKFNLIDINKSGFSFKPDIENNQILYGMKGLLNVSDEIIQEIIKNRPYASPKEFLQKVKIGKQAMVSLIKGGAFDNMMDRKLCMGWYLWEVCDKKNRLTLQNMASLIKYNLLPENNEEEIMARRVYEFNRYLKAVCKYNDKDYKLDERAINFITELDKLSLISENNFMSMKIWDKYYQGWMDIFRKWINDNKEEILNKLNTQIFKDEWMKYANGNLSSWEMEVLCFYYHDHELKNMNKSQYGIDNFFKLPEEPIVDRTFTKGGKVIKLFKLTHIAGTCIAKNKTKGTISLLTPDGVVSVRMAKELFSLFDRQISEKDMDGVKHVVDKSWFNRGSMLMFTGVRSGDDFLVKKYSSTLSHRIYKIISIDDKGSLEMIYERKNSEE